MIFEWLEQMAHERARELSRSPEPGTRQQSEVM
jgi:hypothetical protein